MKSTVRQSEPDALGFARWCFVVTLTSSLFASGANGQPIWSATRDRLWSPVADTTFRFKNVVSLLQSPNGEIVVVDGGDRRVSTFDSVGKLQYQFGKQGSRPGEFVNIRTAGFLGDTLWVAEGSRQRISFFLRNRIVVTHDISYAPKSPWFIPATPRGLLRNGAAVALPSVLPEAMQAGGPRANSLILLSRTGQLLDSIASLKIGHPAIIDASGVYLFSPFDDASLWKTAPDGSGIVVLHRDVSTAQGQREFRVVRFDANGRKMFENSYEYEAKRITQSIVDSVIEAGLKTFMVGRSIASGKAGDSLRKLLYTPAVVPPASGVVIAVDGSLWVQRYATRLHTFWMVIDSTGKVAATLSLPATLNVLYVTNSVIWGIEDDAINGRSIVRYVIKRPR